MSEIIIDDLTLKSIQSIAKTLERIAAKLESINERLAEIDTDIQGLLPDQEGEETKSYTSAQIADMIDGSDFDGLKWVPKK